MDLVDKEDARDEFSNPLINVLVDHLIDLRAKLLGDLRLLRLHHLPHHGDEVLTALGLGIREVEVVERHVLHNLLLLMHVALGEGHVLLRLEIELGGECVRAAHTLHRARVRLNVDDVAGEYLLLLDGVVDSRVELELLGAFGRLEPDDHVRHNLAVATHGRLALFRGELCDLAMRVW